MGMVVMGLVVAGPAGDAEVMARTVVHGVQEVSLIAAGLPVPGHADAPAVGQVETADVDGVGCGVLTAAVLPIGIADDVAACIAAETLDRHDGLLEDLLGQR